MCGIAGFIYKNNNTVKESMIKKMTDAIAHRGPDAEGQYVDRNIGLGHRRLSIIDLSDDGTQPMCSKDGRFVITFNGEIYNYIELRKELEDAGVSFFSKTDTEVIIEAYRKWGVECINRFNGMWAFCLYDREKRKIILSRDRFGVKPLYYFADDEKIVFGSEAKAILAVCPEEMIPNEKAIYRLLRSTPEDRDEITYYKNIKNFRKATYAVLNLDSFEWIQKEFWEIDLAKFKRKWIDGKNPYRTFRNLMEDAVKLRLCADVEVGLCLSGGLDSSLIAGICEHKCGAKMHTFSSVYKDVECNELDYINEVNDFNERSIQHLIYPEPKGENIIEHFRQIILHHDGPNSGATFYSQYSVMRGAKSHVKVLIDGQGADELFGGYIPYYYSYISDLLRKGSIRSKLKAVKTLSIFDNEWKNVNKSMGLDDVILYLGDGFYQFLKERWNRDLPDSAEKESFLKKGMYTKDFLKKTDTTIEYKNYNLSGGLNTVLGKEILRDSIPLLLHNEDSNSMAFSIETRLPFLDYRLVEFALALDSEYKIKGEWTKFIIRKSCKDYFPKKVARRKNKMGFPAPFARWLRESEQKDEMREIIFSFGERNIVPMETIIALYNKHMEGKEDNNVILYKFLVIELWLRECERERV